MIILAVLDAASIFMLVRIARKEKKAKKAEEKALRMAMAQGEVHVVRPKKKEKKHSHFVWILALVVIVALVLIVKILSGQTTSSGTETESTTYTETATLGDISTVLPGTGTLVEEDAIELSLPSEVEITKWYVSNGDTVEEGDTLAAVDTVSVMTAIASVQESLSSLDEALEECEDDAVSSTITAAADARVIKVYAEADTSIVDTMYEYEALMLLSLDGYLAVSFETDADISAGDSVTVTLSDDTEMTGKVESLTNKTAVIVVSDDGPELGDTVTVTTTDGDTIGTGELYIHSALKVTGFLGTVSSVSVSEGDEVSSGDTLLTLTDTDYTGAYEVLLEQRSELESQMETLFKLYQDGYIYASASGVISGLSSTTSSTSDEDADSADETDATASTDEAATSSSASDATEATGTSSTSTSGYSATSLSYTSTNSASATTLKITKTSTASTANQTDAVVVLTTATDDSGSSADDESESESLTDDGETTVAAAFKLCCVVLIDDTTATVSNVSGGLDGVISLEKLSGIYKDGSYQSSVSVSDVSVGDLLIVLYDSDGEISAILCMATTEATSSDADAFASADGSAQTGDGVSEGAGQSGQDQSQDGADTLSGDASGGNTDGLTGEITGANEAGATDQAGDDTQMSADASAAGTDASAADASASMSDASGDALESAISTTYGVSETTWLSITPQETMTVTITVDEMDILSLSVGLEATVTLDAFPGQSFVGEVTAINQSGTNSGGSSKYTAEVTIAREDGMLAGMNASAVITLSTTENVLIVPETALVEQDGAVYVYTSYDESSDTLGDLVEVTTGCSDGTNVEITSGLAEGDTYYYSVLDVVNYSSSYATSSGSSFSLQSLMGGGGMR